MAKQERVADLQHTLWRNLPKYPSTFATCPRCGEHAGRGGGLCFTCAQAELRKEIGKSLADKYARRIQWVRELEKEIDEKIHGNP
jgi:hypothetical protein